ncbi:MAG: choice-of-anchor I family protein [Bulleidia sp.]
MKRLMRILLSIVLLFPFTSAIHAEGETNIRIEQIYGGNGKGDTPISNSFVQLYNPTETAVDLSGYTITDGTTTVTLTGTIPAQGSYLIVGAAEETTDEFLTYDLPEADQICDWVINNKSYTITLNNGETQVDSVTAGNSDATKISKQKSLRRNPETGVFELVVWEKTSVTVDDTYVNTYAPRNSKGKYGSVHGAAQEPETPTEPAPEEPKPEEPAPTEPTFTPVVTGNTKVTAFFNDGSDVKMQLTGRYNSGAMNADGGSLEIVAYNPVNGYAYAVSGVKGKLIAVNLNDEMNGETVTELQGTEYDLKKMVTVDGFTYGDMTSVSVSPDGTKIAVAIQAENYADVGKAALFACGNDGSLTLLSTVSVGVQPDMITFADNNTILTADEAEPREGVNGTDPKGSVSIIKVNSDNTMTAKTVYFDAFDAQRDALTGAGVLIQKGSNPSTDFEPEYIAVSGNTAYVSLQEANAIAVLDINAGTFTGVYPLGFVDYGTTKVDLQKNDKFELNNYPNVYGIRMPDGISVKQINGKTYLFTANEGDSRADWAGLDNEAEGKTSPTGSVTLDSKVVWFNATMWDGLDDSKAYVFGGRSFSIYEATVSGLSLVYDSGSDFEEKTAEVLPQYFNTSNDKNSIDNRSGKKGPEPESVITGVINDRTLAFVALERISGIMVYDVTDPANAEFVNYINSREFDEAIKGDVSPEGLAFISAEQSKTGKAYLLAANEVSGTLAVYECSAAGVEKPQEPDTTTGDYVETVNAQVSDKISKEDAEVIEKTLDKATVSNVLSSLKPGTVDELLKGIENKGDLVIEIVNTVTVTAVDLKSEKKSITFEITPTAVVKSGNETLKTATLDNSQLTGEKNIIVTLPTNGLDVKEIVHRSEGYDPEYIHDFTVSKDGTVTFKISHFSTFTLSEEITKTPIEAKPSPVTAVTDSNSNNIWTGVLLFSAVMILGSVILNRRKNTN